MSEHIMFDIETLDTSDTAMIVSIGAVKFDINTGKQGEEFYRVIDLQSQVENPQRTVSLDTLKWWMRQSDTPRAVFSTADNELSTLEQALVEFAEFCEKCETVWANDPTFDCAIIRHSCKPYDIKLPFEFFQERSVRTLRHTIAPLFDIDCDVSPKLAAHNALNDAKMQAYEICYILANLQKL